MPLLTCYVDDATHDILRRVALETGRDIEELAEAAIAEAALDSSRSRGEPPTMQLPLRSE